MSRCAVLGLVAALALPGPAFALRELMFGNRPVGPGELGLDEKALPAVNMEERVCLSVGGLVQDVEAHFKGGPASVNEALRRFANVPAGEHEVVLLPFAGTPLPYDKKAPMAYDWVLHIPGARRAGRGPVVDRVTLTVYIPNPGPPAPADPKAARGWIADLGSDEFKVRERAAKELAALGPSAAGLFREALKAHPTPEARDRLEKLLADVSRELRVDTLDVPAGLTVVGPDVLVARARAKLADKAGHIRGDGAILLAACPIPAEEILPELGKILKTESEWDSHAAYGAAMGAYRLGAAAKPLVPALRVAAGAKDKYVADMCKQAIEVIEKSKPDPIPEAEAKKRAVIRKEIKELVAARAGK